MEDPELEAIRQRRMAELQQQAQNQAAQEEQARRMEAQKQNALRQFLTPEARQRLANIRLPSESLLKFAHAPRPSLGVAEELPVGPEHDPCGDTAVLVDLLVQPLFHCGGLCA